MKTALQVLIISIFALSSCKKEKHDAPGEEVHISFQAKSKDFNFPYPWCSVSWDNLAVSWSMSKAINPFDGFSISLYGHMDTKEYTIIRNKYSNIQLKYYDSSDLEYKMEEGKFNLIKCDSLHYTYKGEFSGHFIAEDNSDSFDAMNGNFYFVKSF